MDPEAVVSSGIVSICNFIDPNNVSFSPIDALLAPFFEVYTYSYPEKTVHST